MQKFGNLIILLALLMASPLAVAGDYGYQRLAGNDRTEKEIQWAWKQLPDFLRACSYSKECGLTDYQRGLVQQIVGNQGSYGPQTLKFISETDNGGFTSATGEVERIALTGSVAGSTIYINKDRSTNFGKSLGIAFWMGLLSHELTHHLGIKDDAARIPDQLGSAITQAAASLLVINQAPEDTQETTIAFLNPPIPQTTQVLQGFPNGLMLHSFLMDSESAYDDSGFESFMSQSNFCKTKQFTYIRVSSEGVRSAPKTDQPGALTINAVLDADVICLDTTIPQLMKGQITIERGFVLNSANGGGYTTDLTHFTWREGSAQEATGIYLHAGILKSNVPTTVAAGSTMTMTATLKAEPGTHVSGCDIFMTSKAWAHPDASMPFSIYPDSCTLTPLGGDVYAIQATRKIPQTAPSQILEVQYFCLSMADKNGLCDPATPQKQTLIRITGAAAPPSVITNLALSNARTISNTGIRFDYGDHYDISFVITNATGVLASEFSEYTSDASGNGIQFVFPFDIGTGVFTSETVVDVHSVQSGPNLQVRVSLKLPVAYNGTYTPNAVQPEKLTVLTKELNGIFVDLRPYIWTLQPAPGGNQ